MQQWALDVRAVLYALAGGRATARRGGHVPQLPRRDLQDFRLQKPRRREDGVRTAVRVQVLHRRVPATLAAAPRGEDVRGQVSPSHFPQTPRSPLRPPPFRLTYDKPHSNRTFFLPQEFQVLANGSGLVAEGRFRVRWFGSHCDQCVLARAGRVAEAGPRGCGGARQAARGPQVRGLPARLPAPLTNTSDRRFVMIITPGECEPNTSRTLAALCTASNSFPRVG